MIGSSVLQRIGLAALAFSFVVAAPIIFPRSASVYGQIGNTIGGFVFGIQRVPIADVDVELLDDLNRTISRTRTTGSGQYMFNAVGVGNFVVRVRPFQTDYLEQEQPVQIVSMTFGNNTFGSTNEYKDFYLKLKPGVTPAMAAMAIFAQEVPDAAKKLYDRALVELSEKRSAEAHASLRAALELFPRYHAALERLGTEYLRLGKPAYNEAAEILLKVAVEVYPKGYKSWYGLAGALYAQNKYEAALTAVQKANELNAGMPEAAILTGRLLRNAKKYAEAEKQFLRARQLSNNTNPEVNWQLALLYGNDLKRYSDAARELRLFLKARPDSKDADQIKKLIEEFETKAVAAKKPSASGT